MAKKKVSSTEDAIKFFKEVMERASLTDYNYVDSIIISKNNNENNILIVPDETLWNKLKEDDVDNEYKELDITNPEECKMISLIEYGKDLSSDWLQIDTSNELYNGKVFKIKINEYEYKIPINRDLMPMKLKKAEYEDVCYKIFLKPLQILAIKKRFENKVDGFGFTIIRLFQII